MATIDTNTQCELRFIDAKDLKADTQKRTVSGYGVVYNSLSQDLGGFKERIMPGAAADAFAAGSDSRLLVDHNLQKLLGRTASGTLKLSDDATGVRFECNVPATSYGNDLLELLNRNDVSKCSFGFIVPDGGDKFITENNQVIREINKLQLYEISILTAADPAYTSTSVDLRVAPAVKMRISEKMNNDNVKRHYELTYNLLRG